MRNKLSLLALALALGTGIGWAAPPTTDMEAAERIQSRLDHAKVNQHGDVNVTCDNGAATLTGTVDNLASKLAAEKAARKAPGVSQVVDKIQVRAEDVNDQQILQQARHQILLYYAFTIFDNVDFQVNHGALTVTGQVTQPFKKADMGRILEGVKGVTALQNDVEVLPNSAFDDRLRLQLARAIYGNPYFSPYANLAQPPIHIIVKNQNVTLEGVVGTNMDRIEAGMVANHTGLAFSVVNNLRVVPA